MSAENTKRWAHMKKLNTTLPHLFFLNNYIGSARVLTMFVQLKARSLIFGMTLCIWAAVQSFIDPFCVKQYIDVLLQI